ncbi:hypothetical protein Tco_1368435 [Tanacetum coccineum]
MKIPSWNIKVSRPGELKDNFSFGSCFEDFIQLYLYLLGTLRYDQEGYTKGEVRDRVMLKVSPWKGVVRFGKQEKLNPRYVGPFQVLAKVGAIAYKLELPQELSRVHNTFHVSNLKKCYADEPLVVSLSFILWKNP